MSEICLGMVRSWGRWSRLVGWPDWVRGRLVLWEGGDTVVLDISDITAISVGVSRVSHNLSAPIGQGHTVVASHGLGVRGLSLLGFQVWST